MNKKKEKEGDEEEGDEGPACSPRFFREICI